MWAVPLDQSFPIAVGSLTVMRTLQCVEVSGGSSIRFIGTKVEKASSHPGLRAVKEMKMSSVATGKIGSVPLSDRLFALEW
jgi:hypothetical protein